MIVGVNPHGWLHLSAEAKVLEHAKVLELGGGGNPQFQPNVDVRYCHDADGRPTVAFTADFDKPLPIASDEWDIVFSRYAIEHVAWRSVRTFVEEIYRILKPGGTAVIITADAQAQMRWALAQPIWDERISQCIGGDQDYPDNSHKTFFSPTWACNLFRQVGFKRVIVYPHGALATDMVIEAYKSRSRVRQDVAVDP